MGKRSGATAVLPVRGTGGAGVALAAVFLTLVCAHRAEAIPAFSRVYKTECTTCHSIAPQRNEFGQAYEKNGFVWPGAVPLSKKVKVAETEEERKSAEYIMLSGIPSVVPLSVALNVSYLYNEKAEDDFDMKRFSAEILGGGAFGGDRIGFWFSQGLGSQSGGPEAPSQVYFVARHPFRVPVHLKVGVFSPDLSLWVGNDHLIGRPQSMGARVDGFSVTGSQAGLELASFLGSRVQAVVGMNDRNNSSDDDSPHSVNDFYARVGAKFGGIDYLGKEPEVDLDKDSVWDYLSVTCGAFGYSGSTSEGDGVDHDLTRIGVEAGAAYKKWLLMVGATFGENNAEAADPLHSTAVSAEVNYVYSRKFAAAVRYDSVDVDGKDLRTVVTPGVVYAPLQNFRLRLTVPVDSNPGNAGTGKAVKNTTATLTASMSF